MTATMPRAKRNDDRTNVSPDEMQWRSHGGVLCPLDSEKIAKNREKEGKNRKQREKSGKKRKNREGSFTLPPPHRAGYTLLMK